jgi:hypothetical protein
MDNEILKQLADTQAQLTELVTDLRNDKAEKAAGNWHTAVRLHGNTGIFSTSGLERDIITAYVRPQGIASILPAIPSVSENPRYGSITGFTATTGDQPANACQDAPTGYMKGCNLTAAFGLKRFDTQTIEMDKVMLKLNRGDFTDLILHGQLLTNMGLRPGNMTESQVLNVITMAEMIIVGANFERALKTDMWQGTVAAGSFPGLDSQIATGQVDADTNTACPALDSDVKDFNYNDVCGTTLDIVEYLSMMMYYLEYNADAMGLAPVSYAIVMTKGLWYELSACWPCSYMSNRCRNSGGTNILSVNDNTNVNERDRMRRDMVIPVNGKEYPVIIDDGIYEYNSTNSASVAAGSFASAIYAVPLVISGGFPTTYIEYVDYRQAMPDTSLLQGLEEFFWTDNGRFSWAIDNNRWCYQLSAKIEQRVILRTPQLAGKIQRVGYTPLQHLRDSDADSPYNYDGGVSMRSASTYYAVWESGNPTTRS